MSAYPPGRPPSGPPHGHDPRLHGSRTPGTDPYADLFAGDGNGRQDGDPPHAQLPPGAQHGPPGHQQSPYGAQQWPRGHQQWPYGHQQWPPGHQPGPAPHGEPPRAGRGRLAAAALGALLVGAVVTVGAGWLLVGGTAEAADPTPAQADAEHACEVAHRLPADVDLTALGPYDEDPSVSLIHSLGELGTAAALADPTYSEIQTHGVATRDALLYFDNDGATEAIADLRAACVRLGLEEEGS